MSYLGDITLEDTIDFKFTTVGTTGAPTQLAGSPVISAYPGNSTTELTAGITLSVDFDSRTGFNNCRVVATNANGYAAGNYAMVITTGTVGGTSVVGYVVGEFSISSRSALRPTTVGRTLDVSAGGEAGLDWANIGSPTTSLALTGTTIATTQKVDIETIKTNPVVNGGTITFPTTATLASTANITAGTITTVTNLTNAPTAGDLTATMKTSVTTAATAATPIAASVSGAVASVTGNVGGNVTGSVGSVVAAVAVTSNVKKNQALAGFTFIMTDSTNHNPATGLTVTATRSLDGASFGACANAVAEVSNGLYKINLAAADLNANNVDLRFTATGCDDLNIGILTQP